MEIAPPPLNVLCELCKADFPEGKPWKCFDADIDRREFQFRSSSIKQIKDSVTLGCHVCCILWNALREWNYFNNKFTDENIYYLRWCNPHPWILGQSEKVQSEKAEFEIKADLPSLNLFHTQSLRLSRVNSIRKRVDGEENMWEIKLADDNNWVNGNTAAQCSSVVSVGQRMITQISKWLQMCENDHEYCRNKAGALSISGTHGFRLINVGDGNITPVHLINTNHLGYLPRYFTLSHRWTEATKLTQLTWTNLDQHLTGIDTGRWSQVYKDAVTFTRQLGIQYLWIDSICIIQDTRKDLVLQDWDGQSALMDQIYANGVLNLASIEGTAGEGFMTTRNILSEFPCVLRGRVESDGLTTSSYLLYRNEHNMDVIGHAPLSKRGWIYQERMLSKRAVYFGRQIHWECASLSAKEAFPSGYSLYTNRFLLGAKALTIKKDLHWGAELRHDRADQLSLPVLWESIVETYTRTELSNLSDRLVALRGIVNFMHTQWDIPDVQYAAGIWRKGLPVMMVWWRDGEIEMVKEECAARRTLLHHFPSWSWASCNSSVRMDSILSTSQELISVEYIRGSDDKARTAVSAEIILHGWTETFSSTLFPRNHSPYMHGNWIKFDMPGTKDPVHIRWDAPTDHTSEPWYLLPVICKDYSKGFVLQRVATEDRMPTFSRLGFYEGKLDPVLRTQFTDLEKGEDWDAKLLLAPLIRLV